MKLEQFKQILMEDKIEMTKGQGYFCMFHNKGMIPSVHADGDAVLMTAGLAYAMEQNKQVEAMVRSAVVYFDKVKAEGGEVL